MPPCVSPLFGLWWKEHPRYQPAWYSCLQRTQPDVCQGFLLTTLFHTLEVRVRNFIIYRWSVSLYNIPAHNVLQQYSCCIEITTFSNFLNTAILYVAIHYGQHSYGGKWRRCLSSGAYLYTSTDCRSESFRIDENRIDECRLGECA